MAENIATAAALAVHRVIENVKPKDTVSSGIFDAAKLLQERGQVDFSNDDQKRSFARAVHDVMGSMGEYHQVMSVDSSDVMRGVLTAWSLDQVREFHSRRDVPDDYDRHLRDIGALNGPIEAVADEPSILNAKVWEMSRDAVLINASINLELREGYADWEMDREGKVRDEMASGFQPINQHAQVTQSQAADFAMEAAADAVNARYDYEDAVAKEGMPHDTVAQIQASDARRAFPGDLSPSQEGLRAAEAWMTDKLKRPLSALEYAVSDLAYDRMVEREGGGIAAEKAARTIALEIGTHVMVQANQSRDPAAKLLVVDMGKFLSSASLETELGMMIAKDKGERARDALILDQGGKALSAPRSITKGVERDAPKTHHAPAKDRGR